MRSVRCLRNGDRSESFFRGGEKELRNLWETPEGELDGIYVYLGMWRIRFNL